MTHRKHRPLRHAAHRPRHPAHHAAAPPVLRKLTYASPLCEKRSRLINELIGLPDMLDEATQIPVAALEADVQDRKFGQSLAGAYLGGSHWNPTFPVDVGPVLWPPTGPQGPGGPDNPNPPNPPKPPTPPSSPVPEPANWATMIFGMALIGGSIRRRRMRASTAEPISGSG